MECKICKNEKENKIYEAREMMFGIRENFTYFQCSACNCLQIADIPADMSRYYPSDYYSFSLGLKAENPVKEFIKNHRNKYAVLNDSIIGKLLYNYFPNETYKTLSLLNLTKDTSILDVGCGNGALLHSLKEIGFKTLQGADPFIESEIIYPNGLKIAKQSIHEVKGKWDVIMLHHSFEHMSDPAETLRSIERLLSPTGCCLIRIPTASSFAWQHYSTNWVQLDAPRHFFLHSLESMDLLVKQSGLYIDKVVFDSNSFQFWGSEQYIKDIPLFDTKSYAVNKNGSVFSNSEIKTFEEKARELNKNKQGDSGAFFIRKGNLN